jgi:RNA polymerase sigma factor (sigma-70 family)
MLKPEGPVVRLSAVAADDPSLVAFCRSEWPRLVGSLSLYVGRRELAEDLAQEALLRVCRDWESVRRADSPSAWTHRVGFNLAKSHLRREAVWGRIRSQAITHDAVGVDPGDAHAVAVQQAVASLPDRQRAVLVLRYFADLSVADVARLLRIPENTVKTHARRALDVLRASGMLNDDDPADDSINRESIAKESA